MKNLGFTMLVCVIALPTLVAQEIHISKKYELVKLGDQINTRHDDAAPVISPDGKTLYFFISNHPENNYGTGGSQDIWVSTLGEDGHWGPAEHLSGTLNTNRGNQVFTVLNGGNTLFIRGGSKKDSPGFSIVERSGRSWSSPSELSVDAFEEMNLNRFYGATLSSDMEFMILYFSDNPRMVRSDLYVSKRISGRKYSKPIRLKGEINTGWDEFGPFLSPDNRSLYFASDRKDEKAQGGADLYVSRRLDDTWLNWSKPVNLGPPVNTSQFDGYISVDAAGNIFVAMAGKKIDGGNLDLIHAVPKDIDYALEGKVVDKFTREVLMSNVRISQSNNWGDTLVSGSAGFRSMLPGEGSYRVVATKEGYNQATVEFSLKDVYNDTTVSLEIELATVRKVMIAGGTVYNSKTNEIITGAEVLLHSEGSDAVLKRVIASNGSYSFEIDTEGSYEVEGSKSEYLNGNSAFFINQDSPERTADIFLEPIEVGTTVVLENIYFDFNETTLQEESFVELNKVVDFLNKNPNLRVELSGHTDAVGNDDYNQRLSQGRAESVVQYLIGQGITEDRLVPVGYGESKPIETNDTDEGRAANRRVEFVVLEI